MPVTLLDIAKSTGSEGLAGLVEEVVPAVPELGLFPIKPIKGIDYKANIRTKLPQGGFRSANEGSTATKSELNFVVTKFPAGRTASTAAFA